MKYNEYLKQFEGQECYLKRTPEEDGMTVYFYSTQPEKTQYVLLQEVHDDFAVFLYKRAFDSDITYQYSYVCSLNALFVETEEIDISTLTENEIKSIIHNLDVHRVELEMQNDQLQCALAQVEETKNRFEELFEFAPNGYVILKHNFKTRKVKTFLVLFLFCFF